jgi:hypothetical protein
MPTRHFIPLALQYAAMIANRPVNSVYNPRLSVDCKQEAESARTGPWREDALYVFLEQKAAEDFQPEPLSCTTFAYGVWCMGPKQKPSDRRAISKPG